MSARMADRHAPFQRILLTGATGFVGGHLAPALSEAAPAAERLALCRPRTKMRQFGWEAAEAEICDSDAVAEIVARFHPDLVIHLAAQASVSAARNLAEQTWRVNCVGSLNLASACARFAPTAVFFLVSSSEVYGSGFLSGPIDECATPLPANAYARSKFASEQVVADILPADARLIIVRPFNHIGPGQDERFALASFAAQIARIEADRQPPLIRVGNLDAERDFLDVRDVCDAYISLIRATHKLPPRSVFNVASGVSRSIRSLLEQMRALSTTPFEIILDPTRLRPSEIPRAVGLSDRLRSETGWKPSHTIEQSLIALLQSARQILT
jgi:GDP-4-dehydro-6-deoxy-D-mannose reductase